MALKATSIILMIIFSVPFVDQECLAGRNCIPIRNCPIGREIKEKADAVSNVFDKLEKLKSLEGLQCGENNEEEKMCCEEKKAETILKNYQQNEYQPPTLK